MPGHKRKKEAGPDGLREVLDMDITEITGYDDLHHPEGMIRESMDLLREIYKSKESWYLVNGSTIGILAAISAVCEPGDKILIARNCHKSVYNAVRLRRLRACYLYPAYSEDYDIMLDIGEKERRELKEILENEKDIRAVVITSPTYEGVVTDIRAVRQVISEYDDRIPLIVDEAHGAHMIFHGDFPESAVLSGADIVVQSAHKTLPALTQTGLMHLCSDRVSPALLFEWISVYETSSPSYLLMASAESAVIFMHNRGKKLQKYVDNLKDFRHKCGQLIHIQLFGSENLPVFDYDMSKLVFIVDKCEKDGNWLFSRLRDEWNLELEMAARRYALAMTSVMDEEEDFQNLWEAVRTIDQEIDRELRSQSDLEKSREMEQGRISPVSMKAASDPLSRKARKEMEPWECPRGGAVLCPLSESVGQIAASYVMVYPPGIPLLVPGEKIMKEMVENLKVSLYNGYNVQGLAGDKIPVMPNKRINWR